MNKSARDDTANDLPNWLLSATFGRDPICDSSLFPTCTRELSMYIPKRNNAFCPACINTAEWIDVPYELRLWFAEATTGRSPICDAARIRIWREISTHYLDAREESLRNGLNETEAHEVAMKSLGDPKISRKEFRREYLSVREEWLKTKILRTYKTQNIAKADFTFLDLPIVLSLPGGACIAAVANEYYFVWFCVFLFFALLFSPVILYFVRIKAAFIIYFTIYSVLQAWKSMLSAILWTVPLSFFFTESSGQFYTGHLWFILIFSVMGTPILASYEAIQSTLDGFRIPKKLICEQPFTGMAKGV